MLSLHLLKKGVNLIKDQKKRFPFHPAYGCQNDIERSLLLLFAVLLKFAFSLHQLNLIIMFSVLVTFHIV